MRSTARVSKRMDFARERGAQGRSLNTAVRELARLIEPVAQQHGIDLQARLKEASARRSEERRLLAERLQESVVPLFFVLGYSAPRTQVKVSRAQRHIHQRSFHCSTNPVDAAEYLQEGMPQADHVLLDFDHKEIVIGERRVNPPKLQGVSGGGVFHISRETKLGPLVAIGTQNRRNSRLIGGTRIKHFLAMVGELKGDGDAERRIRDF